MHPVRGVRVVLFVAIVIGRWAVAQELPALLVSPAKANILVGDERTFRAVGKDGRVRHDVRWTVSPGHAATLTISGDEATLEAKQPSANVTVTASAGGDSSEANIEILSGTKMANGTAIWSVPKLPGCESGPMSQAVPTANGPDLYLDETCPQGRIIRAFTSDGREIWRSLLGSGVRTPVGQAPNGPVPPGERLNLQGNSVCDAIAPGMTKEKIAELIDARHLHLEEKQRQSDSWTLEEDGFRCTILFDSSTGSVTKKKKIVVTD